MLWIELSKEDTKVLKESYQNMVASRILHMHGNHYKRLANNDFISTNLKPFWASAFLWGFKSSSLDGQACISSFKLPVEKKSIPLDRETEEPRLGRLKISERFH